LGATIFVLPEDIMEVKPKMILTFVGTLMALAKSQ
jgi:plastin-1